jgi:chemotaxis protein MotB
MLTSEAGEPIVIIKKRRHAGGHHGGAWKVAYADFATAMMALFIVLWLTNSTEQVKKAVGGYFRDPTGSGKQTGTGMGAVGESMPIARQDLNDVKKKLEQALRQAPDLEKVRNHVDMTVTGEGLRIELLETEVGTFFDSSSAHPTQQGGKMLTVLAQELGKLKNRITIEGHTDSRPFAAKGLYSNWELSSDRANAARRLMTASGVGADQIADIRGYADKKLRKPADPADASNRRISIVVQWNPTSERTQVAEHSNRPRT